MLSTMRVGTSSINWTRLSLWSILNAISFGAIAMLFHDFPLAFDFPNGVTLLGEFDGGAAIFGGLLFGAIPAVWIGIAQTIFLRRYFPISRWWILSPMLGVGFVHFLTDGFPGAHDLTFALILSGLAFGAFQARLLTRHLLSVNGFGVASVVGWVSGWMVVMTIINQTELAWRLHYEQQHGLQGLCVGIMYGLLTGLVLFRSSHTRESVR